jgi:hypothetical protein
MLACDISSILPRVRGEAVVRAWAGPSRCFAPTAIVTCPPPRWHAHASANIFLDGIVFVMVARFAPGLPSLGALAVFCVGGEQGMPHHTHCLRLPTYHCVYMCLRRLCFWQRSCAWQKIPEQCVASSTRVSRCVPSEVFTPNGLDATIPVAKACARRPRVAASILYGRRECCALLARGGK